MNVLAIYGVIFIITFIVLGLKFEFKKVSFLKTIGITFAIVMILLLTGILPTHIGKAGDNAFYIYNVYKTARIYGKGDVYVDVPQSVKKVIINKEIERIGSCKGYDNLVTIKMADSVNEIAESAFTSCKSLVEIELSDKVRVIGDHAFSGCESLKNITLPEKLEQIGVWAFMDTNITEINLPNNTIINKSTISKEYDSPTFFGAKKLNRVNIETDNINYDEVDGVIFNKDKTEIICYPSARESDTYVIPDTVKSLGNNIFAFCDNLKELTISKNINTIENNSIWWCKNLESIEIINGVEKIEANAIYSCKKLSKIYIPESVTEISDEFNYISAGYGEKVEKPTIYCSSNSYAEEFAKQYDYNYVINE